MSDDQIMLLPESALARPRIVPKRGHAGRPGRGPEGETCRSCRHYTSVRWSIYTYRKCGRCKPKWTNSAGTDIRAKDPACEFWEGRE